VQRDIKKFKADTTAEQIHQREVDLSGRIIEHNIFNKLQSFLQEKGVQNTTVINGWEVKNTKGKLVGEFDFLIVSLPLRSVIHIETKRSQFHEASNNSNSKESQMSPLQKAAEQLRKCRNILLENIPFPISEDWQYLKWIYFEITSEDELSKTCHKCQDHILTPATSLDDWWSRITAKVESCNNEAVPKTGTYLKILQYLFHQMFIQDDVLSQSKHLPFNITPFFGS